MLQNDPVLHVPDFVCRFVASPMIVSIPVGLL
jgi:hypothetical protein